MQRARGGIAPFERRPLTQVDQQTGRINMSESDANAHEDAEAHPFTGEELAFRVFSLSMLGVCGAILFMIVMGDY